MNIHRTIQRALWTLAASMVLHGAHAAGQIDLVEGNVSVTTVAGQLRIPGKGERVEAGDSIATGQGGEIHVHMDDNGLIALRSNTVLRIEAYTADGGADDRAVFRLLRGSFRSITGWIGKNNPQKYAVHTQTATVGIRGTDHETLVVVDGADEGTYDKVNSGETELLTAHGKVAILPGHAGFTPKTGLEPPRLLAVIPTLFAPTRNEALIDSSKKTLEDSRDERLQQKLKDRERTGAGQDGKAKIGDLQDARKALASFESFLRAFEVGDVSQLRRWLNPSMIGYQQLLDNITLGANECKQTRVNLLNTQVQAGPDLVVIQTNWEKRCLLLPAFTPRLKSGHATILMHLRSGEWSFAAITAGNMFDRADPPVPRVVTPPVVQPPVGGPPVVTPPVVTPPVVTPPVVTPPGGTPPVVTPPVVVPPVGIPPTVCHSVTGAIIPCSIAVIPTSCTLTGRVVPCSRITNRALCTMRGTVLVCP